MNAKLATINLQVADPGRSRQFYQQVLGMVEDTRRSHPPAFVYLHSEGCDLTLASFADAPTLAPSPSIELGFEVREIGPMWDHLAASGVVDTREESMGWGEAIELRDPDGHRVLVYAFRREGEPDDR